MNRSFSVGMPKQQSSVVKYECFPDFTRESLTLLAGDGAARVVGIGVLIGMMSATAVAADIVAGNTGNGILTLADPAVAAGARPGVYQAICIEPAANAGTFEVFGPDGVSIGTATVAVAFDGEVKFTIADGSTDFVAGDAFRITVPEGTKAVAWDPDATDGSAIATGVAIAQGYAADGADGHVLAIVRGPALIAADGIAWPEGASSDEKAAALASLAARGIIARYS